MHTIMNVHVQVSMFALLVLIKQDIFLGRGWLASLQNCLRRSGEGISERDDF